MLITLEHSGTKEAILASNDIKDLIEEIFDYDVEAVVGNNSSTISGYISGKHIFTSNIPPTKSDLATIEYILMNTEL